MAKSKYREDTTRTHGRSLNRSTNRNCWINRYYSRFAFFLEWARKPSLKVVPRPNNPKEGVDPYFSYKKGDTPISEKVPTYFLAQWTEEGKNETQKVFYKFVTLGVINQGRNLFNGVIHSGRASNLRADVRIRQTHMWKENNMVKLETETQFPHPYPLNWWNELWDEKIALLSLNPEEQIKKQIEEYKLLKANQTHLIVDYLRNEVLDDLSVARIGELLLFITIPSKNAFISIPEFAWRPFGRYEIMVRVTSSESCTDSIKYTLDIKNWNDYSFSDKVEYYVEA